MNQIYKHFIFLAVIQLTIAAHLEQRRAGIIDIVPDDSVKNSDGGVFNEHDNSMPVYAPNDGSLLSEVVPDKDIDADELQPVYESRKPKTSSESPLGAVKVINDPNNKMSTSSESPLAGNHDDGAVMDVPARDGVSTSSEAPKVDNVQVDHPIKVDPFSKSPKPGNGRPLKEQHDKENMGKRQDAYYGETLFGDQYPTDNDDSYGQQPQVVYEAPMAYDGDNLAEHAPDINGHDFAGPNDKGDYGDHKGKVEVEGPVDASEESTTEGNDLSNDGQQGDNQLGVDPNAMVDPQYDSGSPTFRRLLQFDPENEFRQVEIQSAILAFISNRQKRDADEPNQEIHGNDETPETENPEDNPEESSSSQRGSGDDLITTPDEGDFSEEDEEEWKEEGNEYEDEIEQEELDSFLDNFLKQESGSGEDPSTNSDTPNVGEVSSGSGGSGHEMDGVISSGESSGDEDEETIPDGTPVIDMINPSEDNKKLGDVSDMIESDASGADALGDVSGLTTEGSGEMEASGEAEDKYWSGEVDENGIESSGNNDTDKEASEQGLDSLFESVKGALEDGSGDVDSGSGESDESLTLTGGSDEDISNEEDSTLTSEDSEEKAGSGEGESSDSSDSEEKEKCKKGKACKVESIPICRNLRPGQSCLAQILDRIRKFQNKKLNEGHNDW